MRWVDAEKTMVTDDNGMFIPADPRNVQFAALDLAKIKPFVEEQQARITNKADIWKRATDDEVVQIDRLLKQQSVKLQRIYEGAQIITDQDELYPALYGGLVKLFGATRADELLAPS